MGDFHERQTQDVLQWGQLTTVIFTCKMNLQYLGLGNKLGEGKKKQNSTRNREATNPLFMRRTWGARTAPPEQLQILSLNGSKYLTFFFFFCSWTFPNSIFHGSQMSGINSALEYFVPTLTLRLRDIEVSPHYCSSLLSETNVVPFLYPSGTRHHHGQHIVHNIFWSEGCWEQATNSGKGGERNHVDKNSACLSVIIQVGDPRLQSWHHGLWAFFTCSSSIVVLMHLKIKLKPGLHNHAQIKTRM